MLFYSRISFSIIGLLVGLSYCVCDSGNHACGFFADGQTGGICNYVTTGPDSAEMGFETVDEVCPAPLSGPGYPACNQAAFNVTLYNCPAAVACYLPPGLTDAAKSNDTSCPSKTSLLTSLGIYNVLGAAFSVVLGKSIKRRL